MTETCDVLVVGLGPAGASAAAAAAARGSRVIALDRRRAPGRPVQCAEFVPAMIAAHADDVARSERQRIEAMATYVEDDPPDPTPDFRGRMLDRAAFDAALVARAVRAGAEVRFSSPVRRVAADGTVLLSDGARLSARVLVGADGPRSVVGRAIGSVNTALVETRQITVPLAAPHAATDIFLSARIPGGYGWLFPKGAIAHVGAGVVPSERARLKEIVAALHARLVADGRLGRDILAITGGAIPVGGMLRVQGALGDTAVLLAGDAAGLANPVTGAGIAAAVHSGRLAGEAAASGGYHEYEEELRDVYARSLARALSRRRELLASAAPGKRELRRAWIAYPEYWQ
ncbi:MAG: NAD(P)/FAD-dependent oxidoreductase [Burkholderiales bacterium]|nr:NAD(P)/FAD-dependent oxidoreductase [Burkholderiales bacterium]